MFGAGDQTAGVCLPGEGRWCFASSATARLASSEPCAIETIHTVGSDDSVLETMNFFRFFVDNSKTKARNDFFDLFNEFYAILKLIILALVVKIKIFVLDIGRSIFADHRLEKVRQFFFI